MQFLNLKDNFVPKIHFDGQNIIVDLYGYSRNGLFYIGSYTFKGK